MSLIFALAVGHMGVSGVEFPALGLNKFNPFDASFGSAPPDTTTQQGKLSSLMRGTSGAHGWTQMPTLTVPSTARKVTIGCRFTGLVKNTGDANTAPFYFNLGGTKYYPFQSVAAGSPIPPTTECYLEVEFDRDNSTITCYIDGMNMGQVGTFNATANAAFGTGWFFGIASRNYNDPRVLLSGDIVVTTKDGVYPDGRLGAVKVSSVPVKVSSVSGLDKTAAEVETIVNARVVNTNGQPLTKGTVAKTTGASAEVNFSLDLAGVDVGRQLAAAIFVGAQRTGSASANATLERVLDGLTKTEQAVDLTTRSADRMNFSTPMIARTASQARSLNDITHKLKIVEA